MNRQDVEAYLRDLPVEEMVAVLESVFSQRVPWPDESSFHDNRFCLSIAWREKLENSDNWGPAELMAVAYVNRDEYDGTEGPNWGLCQNGECSCGLTVQSNVKRGFCPMCGASVYMT